MLVFKYYMIPAMSVILRRKLKEERSLPRSNKIPTLNGAQSSSLIVLELPISSRCAEQGYKGSESKCMQVC